MYLIVLVICLRLSVDIRLILEFLCIIPEDLFKKLSPTLMFYVIPFCWCIYHTFYRAIQSLYKVS